MQTAIFIYYFALGPHPGPPAPVPSPLVAARLCVDRLSAFTTAPRGTVRRLCLRRLSRLGFVSIDCPLSQRLPGAPSGACAFAACRGSALCRSSVRFHHGSRGHCPAPVPSRLTPLGIVCRDSPLGDHS